MLLASAPFLLFPILHIEATFLALILTAVIWLLPLIIRPYPWPSPSPVDLLLLLWGCVLIISILVTADPDLTLPKATGLILGLTTWRFMNQTIRSHRLLSVALVTLGLLGILFISLGSVNVNWLSKISLLSSITAVFPQSLIVLPGTSTLGVHANQLAGTLLYFIPFVLSIWIGLWVTRPSKWRWFGWSLLVIFVIGLLTLTQSRTGWLAFALSLLSVLGLWGLVLSRQQQMYRYIWIAFELFLFIGFAGLVWIGPDRLQSFWTDPVQETAVGNFSSIGFRQEVWRWGVTAAADFPFTGTGLGSFRQVVRRLYPLNVAPDYDIAHAHNIFLQTALDVGIPGLIVYLGIIGLAIVLGWIVARQNERLRPYAIGALGSVAAFHFFGLADAIAPGSKPHLILWIVLGLITAMHRLTAVK